MGAQTWGPAAAETLSIPMHHSGISERFPHGHRIRHRSFSHDLTLNKLIKTVTEKCLLGVPLMAQQKRIWLASMRTRVWSLALLSGLRIGLYHKLQCRSQTWLRFWVAVAMVNASGYNSNSTPNLGTSTCRRCGLKKTQNKTKQRPTFVSLYLLSR